MPQMIRVFQPPLTWADMLPHGQAVGVKVAFSRDLIAVKPLKDMVEVRVFTVDTETNWRPLPVDVENAKIVGNEFENYRVMGFARGVRPDSGSIG